MKRHFVLCIHDGGYPEALEERKFYEAIGDAGAEKEGLIRVIDESGEDYLYPKNLFVTSDLPVQIVKALEATAVAS